jgi:hypothetical protein
MIKLVVLTNNQILISKVEEVGADIGEPDCKLVNPFLVKKSSSESAPLILEPWLLNVSSQDVFMINSDKIITLSDPTPTLLEKYKDLIKE